MPPCKVLKSFFFQRPYVAMAWKKLYIQCILDYPAMLGNLFPKSWPDKHLAGLEKYLS